MLDLDKHPHIKEELPKHTIVRESISTTAAEAREEESTNKVDHSFQCFHSICGLVSFFLDPPDITPCHCCCTKQLYKF
jgi:hypothetical protein